MATRKPLAPWVAPSLVMVVGALLRAPALGLPLGPEDAVLAEAGRALAHGEWPSLEGRGPLVPFLLAGPCLLGLEPALVLRWGGLLLGALVPLLAHAVARRAGFSARGAGFAALLTALHPLLIAHAGGAEAGALGVALTLLLAAVWDLADAGAGTRRRALVWLVLAALALPGAWPYLAGLGSLAVWREPRRCGRAALGALALGLAAWLAFVEHGPAGTWEGGLLLLLVLGLALALPGLLVGGAVLVRRVEQGAGALRTWVGCSVLHLVLLSTSLLAPGAWPSAEGLGPGALLVPWAALCAAVGLARLAPAWRGRLEIATLAVALVGALLLGLGSMQSAVLGARAGLAGRLHALEGAMRLAAQHAGPEGWIVVDLGPHTAAQGRALGPWAQGRRLLVAPSAGGATALPGDWPPGGPAALAFVAVAPEPSGVGTLGGWGVFAQEQVGQVGAYHVWRARRP